MGINELITNDDYLHIHKSFGLFVLSHFFIQTLFYLYYRQVYLYHWNLLPHIALHISSFLFNVLKYRNHSKTMTMFIWEELRLHSMIFASRGCLCILYPNDKIFIVIGTMICADIATYLFGNPNESTVRGNHETTSNSHIKQISSVFFSMSQIGATIICGGLFQVKYSPVLIFATLPPIQTSAFGMTLIRKNIINKQIWQLIYTMELLCVYIIWYMETGNIIILPFSFFVYIMRKMGVNKYMLFTMFFTIDYICNNPKIFIDL